MEYTSFWRPSIVLALQSMLANTVTAIVLAIVVPLLCVIDRRCHVVTF